MRKSMLACCKMYISESRNALALESIEKAAGMHPEAIIVNRFKDQSYNRVGYTLVSAFFRESPTQNCALREAVFSMAEAALQSIDLAKHIGSHPRLGVVDHICFHPLGEASLDQVSALAKSVAADIGSKLQVPTFLYGAAHEEERALDSIRRELGYFKSNLSFRHEFFEVKPDAGPSRLNPANGVVVVGATRWVQNYNVPIWCTNMEVARRIARRVSGRGGGLETVQALALAHGDGWVEVACNLLDPGKVWADQIQSEIQRMAAVEGIRVGQGYFTDFSEEKIVETYLKLISNE
ncbi:hypothetical protein HPP92_022510 [Vanilla planifolia]|uniref:glutamate formimidoyltransferase n=1 Tax=Vanilla planifolia TaxID=51239 RepID=A0A835PU85_VANPL|nr:hypothetical protein HPP92_022510 [Vanilla planifolia]